MKVIIKYILTILLVAGGVCEMSAQVSQRQKGKPKGDFFTDYPKDSILGYWLASEDSARRTASILLTFEKKGKVKLNLSLIGRPGEFLNIATGSDMEAKGKWKMKSGRLTLDIDEKTYSSDCEFVDGDIFRLRPLGVMMESELQGWLREIPFIPVESGSVAEERGEETIFDNVHQQEASDSYIKGSKDGVSPQEPALAIMPRLDWAGNIIKNNVDSIFSGAFSWNRAVFNSSYKIKKDDAECAFSFIGFGPNDRRDMTPLIERTAKGMRQGMTENFGERLSATIDKRGEMVIDGIKLQKVPENKTIVCGKFIRDKSYLYTNEIPEDFIILRWNDWNCNMDLAAFESEFERTKDKEKYIILIPYTMADNSMMFWKTLTYELSVEPLEISTEGRTVSYPFYFRNILRRYKMKE